MREKFSSGSPRGSAESLTRPLHLDRPRSRGGQERRKTKGVRCEQGVISPEAMIGKLDRWRRPSLSLHGKILVSVAHSTL